mgnify:CR=1 FL=1
MYASPLSGVSITWDMVDRFMDIPNMIGLKWTSYDYFTMHRIKELRSGNIDADPCCHSEEDSQCRFCDWVSACQFRDGRDRDRLRYILPVKPEEFWKELEEGGGDPWQS